jgi:hypothetical protein
MLNNTGMLVCVGISDAQAIADEHDVKHANIDVERSIATTCQLCCMVLCFQDEV